MRAEIAAGKSGLLLNPGAYWGRLQRWFPFPNRMRAEGLAPLLAATAIAEVASNVVYIILLERAFELEGETVSVGVVLIIQSIAQVFLGAWVGNLVDRLGQRRAAILATLVAALLSVGLGIGRTILAVYILAFLIMLARYDKLLTECKAEAAALVDEFLEQRNGNTPKVLRQAVEAKVRELEKRQQSYQAERDELAARLAGLTITDEEIKRADAVFNEMYQTLADYDAGLNGATFDDKERIFDMLQVQGDMVDKDGQRGVLLTCRRPGEQHLVHLNKKDNYKKY